MYIGCLKNLLKKTFILDISYIQILLFKLKKISINISGIADVQTVDHSKKSHC